MQCCGPDESFPVQCCVKLSIFQYCVMSCWALSGTVSCQAERCPVQCCVKLSAVRCNAEDYIFYFIFLFLAPEAYLEAPFLRIWDFTVFVATASTSNPWMVTHPSANRGPSCLTSVFLWELVFPTWYSRSRTWYSRSQQLGIAVAKLYCKLWREAEQKSARQYLS